MRLFVVGNINVGKSYVVNQLKNIFPMYPIISIDEYRRRLSDGSIESEYKTRQLFADDIVSFRDAIIEFSGGANITSLFIDQIRDNSAIVLEVQEEVDLCLKRISDKQFDQIPYPVFSEQIEDTIIRLDQEFKKGLIDRNFKSKILMKYKIRSNVDIKQLPLKQYELAIRLADHFENKYELLYAFGSMGRRMMTILSDIDLFLMTNSNIQEVVDHLSSIFQLSKILVQKNQIAVYIDDLLLEINVIKSIDESSLYFNMSLIDNPEKTILLGNSYYAELLKAIQLTYKENIYDIFKQTMSRLEYYSMSLQRVISKGDKYKYFFHTNIVIHEYVRLSYFMTGKSEFHYLPKDAYKLLNQDEWKILVYDFNQDQIQHEMNVKELIYKIMAKAEAYIKKSI